LTAQSSRRALVRKTAKMRTGHKSGGERSVPCVGKREAKVVGAPCSHAAHHPGPGHARSPEKQPAVSKGAGAPRGPSNLWACLEAPFGSALLSKLGFISSWKEGKWSGWRPKRASPDREIRVIMIKGSERLLMQSIEEDSNRDSIQSPRICCCELLPAGRKGGMSPGEEDVLTKERAKGKKKKKRIPNPLKRHCLV